MMLIHLQDIDYLTNVNCKVYEIEIFFLIAFFDRTTSKNVSCSFDQNLSKWGSKFRKIFNNLNAI